MGPAAETLASPLGPFELDDGGPGGDVGGIAVWRETEGGSGREDHFASMMAAIRHRGRDGSSSRRGPDWRLGVQRFWTTPEEVGEGQPLEHGEARFSLAFDGRLDNRDELISALDLQGGVGRSDAVIVLAAFERWREGCFRRLEGPFAVVVVEWDGGRVVCARDPLGERSLFYYREQGLFLAASEECALVSHPSVARRINERSVARFLAVMPPLEGETFFDGVWELPAGHFLVVDGARMNLQRFWDFEPTPVRYVRDEEYLEHFRMLLQRAVRACLRSATRSAFLMSGGLDSTSLASLARVERDSKGPPLLVSWVFDELGEMDERRFIEPMVSHLGLEWTSFLGDGAWPLRDNVPSPVDPNRPWEDHARGLLDGAYAVAAHLGVRTVLAGYGADELFSAWAYWLKGFLDDGRLGTAAAEFSRAVWRRLTQEDSSLVLKAAVRCLLPLGASAGVGPWLTEEARVLVGENGVMGPTAGGEATVRQRHLRNLWGHYAVMSELRRGHEQGVELRRPFRDVRIGTFMASVPAHLLFRPGAEKFLLRSAVRGDLPDCVRVRSRRTSTRALLHRGLMEREKGRVRELLNSTASQWPRYVRRPWINAAMRRGSHGGGRSSLVLWHCVCLERWIREAGGLRSSSSADGTVVRSSGEAA